MKMTTMTSPVGTTPAAETTWPMLPPVAFNAMKEQLALELSKREREAQREFGVRANAPTRQPGDRMLEEAGAKADASRILTNMLRRVGVRAPVV